MEPLFIKVITPQLNEKVERLHLTDHQEFYQLATYKVDVDLHEKLSQWENFYNFKQLHGEDAGTYVLLKTCLDT